MLQPPGLFCQSQSLGFVVFGESASEDLSGGVGSDEGFAGDAFAVPWLTELHHIQATEGNQ
jgi:hypothetical protein